MAQGAARRVARRQITRNGRKLTVVIPRPFVYALGLARGTCLVLELFADQRRFTITPLTKVTPTETERWRIEGSIIAQRVLSKNGNSDTVTIPRLFLHALFVFERDALTLTLDDEATSISVRPLKQRSIGPPAPGSTAGLLGGAR